VTGTVREKLVEQGIIVYPIIQAHRREGNLSTVDTTYRFVDTADGSYLDAVSSGSGTDSQDKGVGKAMTYSMKYLFLRTFAIPSGEDPDKISSAELDDTDKKNAVHQGKIKVMQMLEDNPMLDDDYIGTITQDVDTAYGKQDVDTLRIIYREVETEIRKALAHERKEANEEPPLPTGKPAKSEYDASFPHYSAPTLDDEQMELVKDSQGDRDIF